MISIIMLITRLVLMHPPLSRSYAITSTRCKTLKCPPKVVVSPFLERTPGLRTHQHFKSARSPIPSLNPLIYRLGHRKNRRKPHFSYNKVLVLNYGHILLKRRSVYKKKGSGARSLLRNGNRNFTGLPGFAGF